MRNGKNMFNNWFRFIAVTTTAAAAAAPAIINLINQFVILRSISFASFLCIH